MIISDSLIEKHAATIIEMYFGDDIDVIAIAGHLGLTTDCVATIIRVEYCQILELKRERKRALHKKLDLDESGLKTLTA